MNKIFLILALCFTIVTLGFGQTKKFIDQPYMEVNGYADTLVIPNLIYISVIISEKGNGDRVSVEERENKMIAAFKSMGISPETDLTINDMLSNYKFYLLKP